MDQRINYENKMVNIIPWMTYSWMEEGTKGLGDFLAEIFNKKTKVDISSGNNMDYYISVNLQDIDSFTEEEREELLEDMEYGITDPYSLKHLLIYLVKEKYIPLGNYIIQVSW